MSNKTKYVTLFLIITIIVSYFTFFNDYFKYLEVKNSRSIGTCKSYFFEFPDGYFTEDVKVIEIELSRDIVLVREFFDDYPDSEYSIVKLINIELWNEEIKRYDSIVNSNDFFDPDAVKFFREMLIYMRDNNSSEIVVNLKGNVKVNNFEDYPFSVRQLTDDITQYLDGRKATGNVASLTNNYDDGDIYNYEQIIMESILTSFENLLSDNFISLSKYKDANSSFSNLVINIDYAIKNQENFYEGDLYPEIWTHYELDNNKFISYVLGVSIEFDFSFKLKNSHYSFSLQTNALDNIEGINDISEGYRIMTEQNFKNFADGILKRFGIYGEQGPKLP